MENRTNSIGRSTSMPLLQQQNGDEGRGLSKSRNAFGPMAALQEQDNFRSQNATVWSPNGLSNGFLTPPALNNGFQFGQGFGSNGRPNAGQLSKSSMGDAKGSASADIISPSPEAKTTAVPEDAEDVMGTLSDALSKHRVKADSSVSQPEAQQGRFAAVNPFSSQRSSTLGSKSIYPRSPLGPFDQADHNNGGSSSSSDESVVFKGSDKDSSKNRLPGLGHISPVTDKFSSPQDLEAPNGDLQHRRHSSRISSMPIIPSPLGPRHKSNGAGLAVGGTVSPSPATPTSRSHRQNPEDQNDFPMFGLDTRDFTGPNSRFNTKPFGFGHGRKPTDPFVEEAVKWSQPLKASPFVTQAQQKFKFPIDPDVQVPSTPAFYAQDLEFNGPGPMIWSPAQEQPSNGAHTSRANQSRGPATPSFQGYKNPETRLDLPIPPSPLAAAQSHLVYSPKSRTRLDAQADIRGDWIRNEAKNIADLSTLSFAAAQLFHQTGSQEDYEVWQRLAGAYDDVTSLEKRQEERRNMFMPDGMQAMKTGAKSDQSAAFNTAGGQEEGRLLGFQMAYMERVCAEVKRRAKEEEEKGSISMEMLDTLSLEEKKALREHLVARLQSGTAAMRAGVLSESFL